MIIRPERPEDQAAIAAITQAAFKDHPFSRQTEVFIIEALRRVGDLRLSLVAEDQGQVVGHIAFSPLTIAGQNQGWLGVGPLSVDPPRQRQGIGKALMREGLRRLREQGCPGCLLVGDPGYYKPQGFDNLPGLTLEGVPPEVFLGLALGGDLPQGAVAFHPAFQAQA